MAGEMEEIVTSVSNTGSEIGNLVEVKYQKNTYQSQKYLEAEPKALGVTQIVVGLFILSIAFSIPTKSYFDNRILNFIASSTSIIAGSVAIAAHNLHPPTLKACFGMQIVVCVASAISFFNTFSEMGNYDFNSCWVEQQNSTYIEAMCERLWVKNSL